MISNIAELNAVYPRWRGELTNAAHQGVSSSGLSPLARGTRCCLYRTLRESRFIPAGAGNSQYHYIKECRIPVYPRWRGELGTCLIICVATVGLSPLARGTLPLVSCRPRKNRFIPAGAGNSNSYTDKSSKQTVYPRWRGELTKHNLLLIIDFLSQSQSTNLTETHKQHIHYVKEHLIH